MVSGDGTDQGGRPLLMAGLGAASISASAVLVTLAGANAQATAFYRCALALPPLAVLAVIEQRRRGARPAADRARAAVAGIFLAVDLMLWRHAIADVGAGIATVLGNLQVLFVALIAWLVLRERPHRAILLMLPVVGAGVVLVSGLAGPTPPGLHPVAGVWYGLGTSVAYAGFLLILRQSSSQRTHVAGPVFDATAAAAAVALMAGPFLPGGLALHPLWPAIGWLLVLALVSQTAGWLLITSSLPRLPAAVSSIMLLLQPAAALVLAAVVLRQDPTLLQLVGALLTCGGALVASVAATRKPGPRWQPGTATRLRDQPGIR